MGTAAVPTQQDAFDEEAAWRAVLERNPGADGSFVYAVASTGVFCRPSCPARRARREHVRFFVSAEEAVKAGFRACLRCRPEGAALSPVAQRMEAVRRFLDAHFDEPVTLGQLGRLVGMTPHHLQRTFKRVTGMTPREYVNALRIGRFKSRLKQGAAVTAAMYEAGYGSSSRLYERSDGWLGMTPTAYRRGGRGMHIRFTVSQSPLGRLLIGVTERGVCAVMLGDTDDAVEAAFRREYPNATAERVHDAPGEWCEAIARYVSGEHERLDLPLDVRASAFQWRVWRALQEIPYGSTRSYGDIAAALGAPKAARAVARACAANPMALVIPCHRAIRRDENLGGYRWGMERKRRLLEMEREAARGSTGSG